MLWFQNLVSKNTEPEEKSTLSFRRPYAHVRASSNGDIFAIEKQFFVVHKMKMDASDTLEGLTRDRVATANGFSFYQSHRVIHPVTCPGLYELRPQFDDICLLSYAMFKEGAFAMGSANQDEALAACWKAGLEKEVMVIAIPVHAIEKLVSC